MKIIPIITIKLNINLGLVLNFSPPPSDYPLNGATVAGCFGSGEVKAFNNGTNGGLIFAAPDASFSNRFYKQSNNGMFMNFKSNTTLTGMVDAYVTTYFAADAGVTAVFKNWASIRSSAGSKDINFSGMKGTIVFEDRLTVADLTESAGSDNVGGKVVLANSANSIKRFQLNTIIYVCSNENVMAGSTIIMANRSNGGYVDLNGFDQTVKDFSHASQIAWYNYTGARITSGTPATLTITGTVAGVAAECNNQFDGKVSLVLDADPAYTNRFIHRRSTTTGDITVKSGVFNLGGASSHFANVPKIAIESNGCFLLDTSQSAALASVTNLVLASGARFEVATGSSGTPTAPFTSGLVDLELASDSDFRLMPDTSITVNTLRVNGVCQHKGSYTTAECAAIKSGTVVVLKGPPRGLCISFK